MSEAEIVTFLKKKEVLEYLKKNIELYLSVEACENIDGYDIEAEVFLFGESLAKDEDCI